MSHILDRVIHYSNALDTESLCIIKGVSCWSIRADVHVVDYDGNLTDAACVAIMAGLQHFRRPDAVVRDGQVLIYAPDERVPVPLNITHKPLAVTFRTFDHGQAVIVDATRKEEQAAEGDAVFGINNSGDLCYLSKSSGGPVNPLLLVHNTDVALAKVTALNKIIDAALRADLAKRSKSGLADAARAEFDR